MTNRLSQMEGIRKTDLSCCESSTESNNNWTIKSLHCNNLVSPSSMNGWSRQASFVWGLYLLCQIDPLTYPIDSLEKCFTRFKWHESFCFMGAFCHYKNFYQRWFYGVLPCSDFGHTHDLLSIWNNKSIAILLAGGSQSIFASMTDSGCFFEFWVRLNIGQMFEVHG